MNVDQLFQPKFNRTIIALNSDNKPVDNFNYYNNPDDIESDSGIALTLNLDTGTIEKHPVNNIYTEYPKFLNEGKYLYFCTDEIYVSDNPQDVIDRRDDKLSEIKYFISEHY